MIQKLLHIIISLVMLIGLLALSTSDSYAQEGGIEEPPVSASSQSGNVDTVTFESLGFADRKLRGPFESSSFYFSVPAHWVLLEGAELHLDVDSIRNSLVSTTTGITSLFDSSLEISLNEVLLDTIPLDQDGERTISLPIPPSALISPRSDGRHRLQIEIQSDKECGIGYRSTAIILSSSRFIFPHETTPLSADLTRLPYPIFQRSFLPDEAIIVTPNEPTTGELQATLSVAAGFGSMADSDTAAAVSLIPERELTAEIRESNHLILVGQANHLGLISQVKFPVPVANGKLNTPIAETNDGIIQMAVSPWNPFKVILFVSGNSDAGVVKAGQATSSGTLRGAGRPDLAVVGDVHVDNVDQANFEVDQTFADLGYTVETLEGEGTSSVEFQFQVPHRLAPSNEIYLDLVIAHTRLINYEESGVLVSLNDEAIGSVRLNDETSNLSTARILIPRTAVQPGVNRLVIQSWLIAESACHRFGDKGLWLTIHPESLLHIPLGPSAEAPLRNYLLADYPSPFVQSFTLREVAFVLPANDPAAWDTAAQFVFNLGRKVNIYLSELIAVYSDNIPASIRQTHELIIIGQPSALPIIDELAEELPGPFQPGTNHIAEKTLPFGYRVPAETNVGYLELLRAPWSDRHILTILGNTAIGLQQAVQALLDPPQRDQLNGDLAIIDSGQILVKNTRPNLVIADPIQAPVTPPATKQTVIDVNDSDHMLRSQTPTATITQAVTARPAMSSQLTAPEYQNWIRPAIAVSGLLMVLILLIVLISGLRRRLAQ